MIKCPLCSNDLIFEEYKIYSLCKDDNHLFYYYHDKSFYYNDLINKIAVIVSVIDGKLKGAIIDSNNAKTISNIDPVPPDKILEVIERFIKLKLFF